MVRYKIRPMTERTIEVVAQKPLLQTLAVENVETAQLADFLGAIHLVQTDGTIQSQFSSLYFDRCLGRRISPDEMAIYSLGQT